MVHSLNQYSDLSRVYAVCCPDCGYQEYTKLLHCRNVADRLVWSVCPMCGRDHEPHEAFLRC